jgi:hypothetical protein
MLTPRRLPKRHPEAGALWEKHINKILDDRCTVGKTTSTRFSTTSTLCTLRRRVDIW